MTHRDCPRCDELRERVAWLESELGLQRDQTDVEALRRVILRFRYRSGGIGSAHCARMLLALYRAGGRAMSRYQLMEAAPPSGGGEDDRNANLVGVMMCLARRALGYGAIENVWGSGYRLTPTGIARVAEILGEAQRAAA
jgi:DNA-binding response OmpR family regulator